MAKITIDRERCKACGFCVIYCPKGCIILSDKINKKGVKPAEAKSITGCTGCGFCAIICPDCAIEVFR